MVFVVLVVVLVAVAAAVVGLVCEYFEGGYEFASSRKQKTSRPSLFFEASAHLHGLQDVNKQHTACVALPRAGARRPTSVVVHQNTRHNLAQPHLELDVRVAIKISVGVSVGVSVESTVGVPTVVGACEGYEGLFKLSLALVLRDQHHRACQVESAVRQLNQRVWGRVGSVREGTVSGALPCG